MVTIIGLSFILLLCFVITLFIIHKIIKNKKIVKIPFSNYVIIDSGLGVSWSIKYTINSPIKIIFISKYAITNDLKYYMDRFINVTDDAIKQRKKEIRKRKIKNIL